MPITTPQQHIGAYGGDTDHFPHVLEFLFKPAISKIDYTPIPPVAEGANLIHAGIIEQLETADLVLCDISTLNANVFFELGIRTALDKPVCIVRDALVVHLPFDTGIINHHVYDHSLSPWTLGNEIESLSQHLTATINNSGNRNPLWKYFGLTARARPSEPGSSVEGRIDLLSLQIESLQQQLSEGGVNPIAHPVQIKQKPDGSPEQLVAEAQRIVSRVSAKISTWKFEDPNIVVLDLTRYIITESMADQICQLGESYGYEVKIINGTIRAG
jgi:hypothetical protein